MSFNKAWFGQNKYKSTMLFGGLEVTGGINFIDNKDHSGTVVSTQGNFTLKIKAAGNRKLKLSTKVTADEKEAFQYETQVDRDLRYLLVFYMLTSYDTFC